MSPILEQLCQQLRQLQRRRPSHDNSRRRRHRWHCERSPGGQDPPQHSRYSHTEAQARRAGLPVGSNCIVPLLHIWLRLNAITPISTPISRQRYLRRLRLERRPLRQNLRQILAVNWTNFCLSWRLTPVVDEEATQSMKADQTTVVVSRTSNWINHLITNFFWISKNLESALIHVGPTPSYTNTSGAMEVINFSDISEQLNSVVIEYLVNNDEYYRMSSQSLTELGIFE